MKAPVSVSKLADLGVGGPNLWIWIDGNRNRETMFTLVWALLMEVKPYILLLFILMEMYRMQS
jgi:hypothetical protein